MKKINWIVGSFYEIKKADGSKIEDQFLGRETPKIVTKSGESISLNELGMIDSVKEILRH